MERQIINLTMAPPKVSVPSEQAIDVTEYKGASNGSSFSGDSGDFFIQPVDAEPYLIQTKLSGIPFKRNVLFLCPETYWCVVWDIAANAVADDVIDEDGELVTEWPVEYMKIYLSWVVKQVPTAGNTLFSQTGEGPPNVYTTDNEYRTPFSGVTGLQEGWVCVSSIWHLYSCCEEPGTWTWLSRGWWDPMVYSDMNEYEGTTTTDFGESFIDGVSDKAHVKYYNDQIAGLEECTTYHEMSGGTETQVWTIDETRRYLSGYKFTALNGSEEELVFVLQNDCVSKWVETSPPFVSSPWTQTKDRTINLIGPYMDNVDKSYTVVGSSETTPTCSPHADVIPHNAEMLMGAVGEYDDDENWMYQVFWRMDTFDAYVNEEYTYDVYASSSPGLRPGIAPSTVTEQAELSALLVTAVNKSPRYAGTITRTVQKRTFKTIPL